VDEGLRTAAEAMLTTPVRHPLSATVREIRDFFRDDHVHAALIVSPAGHLEAVVERDDIATCQAPGAAAAPLGRLAGRTIPAGASLADVHRAMTATGRRRTAVTSRLKPAFPGDGYCYLRSANSTFRFLRQRNLRSQFLSLIEKGRYAAPMSAISRLARPLSCKNTEIAGFPSPC